MLNKRDLKIQKIKIREKEKFWQELKDDY